ncbi:hypothetical protein EHF33_10960 [Deinococcus psychrotolerans]|uniref:Uncharacterized protein n=1 Tax=Deinococcus psychrotolerans TaxID=2489213 RepID=A0A3G8YKU2_9DEIO|nr:hypothetical protein [Deinococcus psychrotolerans]AZI43194.1 hypothetical protein EHF33_10960 [Deinococcus psychrotolerans]
MRPLRLWPCCCVLFPARRYALTGQTQSAGFQLKYVGKLGVSLNSAENSKLSEMNTALGPWQRTRSVYTSDR